MQELVVARTGERLIGLASAEVAEIFAPRAVTPLPEPLPHIAGALFHRGRLITVVDTYALVSSGKRSKEAPALLARLGAPREQVALAIGAVEGVIPYNELDLRGGEAPGSLWAGLYPWGEQWVSVLNVAAVCALLDGAVAEGQGWGRPQRRSDAG